MSSTSKNKEGSYSGDSTSTPSSEISAVSLAASTHSLEHPYMGMDEQAQEEIRSYTPLVILLQYLVI